MNPRQGVLIAMFLSVAIYLLANAQASVINQRVSSLKQTPAVPPAVTPPKVTPGSAGGAF